MPRLRSNGAAFYGNMLADHSAERSKNLFSIGADLHDVEPQGRVSEIAAIVQTNRLR